MCHHPEYHTRGSWYHIREHARSPMGHALFVEWQALVVVYLSQMGALAFALVFLDAFITCTCLACGNWLVSDASTRMD